MSEKKRSREEEIEGQEKEGAEVSVDVTIHQTYIGVIRLKRGATLEDLLEELRRLGHFVDLSEFLAIMLDGKTIQMDPDTGKLTENPILSRTCTLSLLKKILGG